MRRPDAQVTAFPEIAQAELSQEVMANPGVTVRYPKLADVLLSGRRKLTQSVTTCELLTPRSIDVPVVTKKSPMSSPRKGLMSASICVR